MVKVVYIEIYVICVCILPFSVFQERREWMDGVGWRWMMFQQLSLSYLISSIIILQEKEQQSVPKLFHLDVILVLDNSCVGGYYYCLRHFTHTLCNGTYKQKKKRKQEQSGGSAPLFTCQTPVESAYSVSCSSKCR
jgi:hypothetical protein